jgi:hypothetical protein
MNSAEAPVDGYPCGTSPWNRARANTIMSYRRDRTIYGDWLAARAIAAARGPSPSATSPTSYVSRRRSLIRRSSTASIASGAFRVMRRPAPFPPREECAGPRRRRVRSSAPPEVADAAAAKAIPVEDVRARCHSRRPA